MKTKYFTGFVLAMFLVSLVSAFGVSSPYWGDNPLQIYRGETKVVNLNLQNMVGSDDVTLRAEVTQGADIASLSEDTYTVPIGISDVVVPLKIRLDRDSPSASSVEVQFKTVATDDDGIVTLGTGMVVGFQVVEVEREGLSTIAWTIIGLAVILVVVIVFLRKKRK